MVIGVALLAAFGAGIAAPAPATATRKKRTAAKRQPKLPTVSGTTQRVTATEEVKAWLDAPSTMENPAALVPFLEQIYRAEKFPEIAAPVHILHYGDSHAASDDWPAATRELFQARFGNGGAGFSHAGRPWNGYRRMDVKSYGPLSWYTHGLIGRSGDGLYGLSGIATTSTRPNESATLDANCQQAELLYLQQPGGGAFELRVDSAEPLKVGTDGDRAPGYVKIPVEPGEHRFAIRTLDTKPVRLFGWTTDNVHGVTWETLGINGAQAGMLLGWDEPLLWAHIYRRSPALIVLAYGTNEAGNSDLTLEGYRSTFGQVLERMRRAAPTASLLVIGPPDRWIRTSGQWAPMAGIDVVVEAQRQAAATAGAAFLDIRARMGGKGSMRQWISAGFAQSDYVHFTSQGYRLLGAALYKELIGQFSAYLKVRDEPTVKAGEN